LLFLIWSVFHLHNSGFASCARMGSQTARRSIETKIAGFLLSKVLDFQGKERVFEYFELTPDGTTFTQPVIRGQKPQEIYSLLRYQAPALYIRGPSMKATGKSTRSPE